MGMIENYRPLAEKLSEYCRLCYDRRLVGAAGGNLSVRIPGKEIFFVTASGVALRDVKPENIVAVDIDENSLEGPEGLRPSKEISFHLAIYKAKPSTNGIIHVHPTYATIFASQNKQLPLATVSARLKLKQGPIAAGANPGSDELCRNMVDSLTRAREDISIILMESHGLVAFDSSLNEAFDDAELAEDTAKIAYMGSLIANPKPLLERKQRVIDLTAPLDERMHCYPTDPPYRHSWHVSMPDAEANVSKLEMGAHSGSHVDAPLHFLEDGAGVASMPVESFIGPAIVIDCPKESGQDVVPEDLSGADINPDDIVLFSTGWEERSCSSRFFDGQWPALSPETVDLLISLKVKAIGGDFASIDNPQAIKKGALSHKKAHSAGLPIFEALVNLEVIAGARVFFIGLPLRLTGVEASPIRAVAIVDANLICRQIGAH